MRKKREERGTVLSVTTARSRLYDLVGDVLEGRSARVELSHREHEEHVVLLRKSELEGLEADLAALRARTGPPPRPLRGMGRLRVEPDDVLRRVRQRQTRLAAAKREAIAVTPDDDERG